MKKPQNRNLAARTPLLRKGGAHQKSKSSERRKAKLKLYREARGLTPSRDYFILTAIL